ncbi:PH domain-containing protein [Gracilibacillus sp. YIM 98692]|uniref:PH domain-containing protein n=1 Tax=Gracilibacillus sp. YIM 98692 TaxID=2663532 RepID=UPI0013D793E8|nr:PH domain-containing protein [Gracilibacillus sp. YIM 98692]
MRLPPRNRIATDAIKAWKLHAHLKAFIPLLFTIGAFAASYFVDFIPYWVGAGLAVLTLLYWGVLALLIPKLKWKRWRYEIFEQEVYIQHGIIVVTRTVVPMVRVQHVDTQQGPILKRYGLSTLEISTAATVHTIPALLESEASDLRDQISELARVEQDDV